MGTALLSAFLSNERKDKPAYQFAAHVKTAASAERLKKDLSTHSDSVAVSFGNDNLGQAAENADVVLLGFLPGDINTVIRLPGVADKLKGKAIVSMLASVPISHIHSELAAATGRSEEKFSVFRIIPTLGATIGESATLVADPEEQFAQDKSQVKLVDDILLQVGSIQHVPEGLMDSATAIGAAAHALAIVAIDGLTDASVAAGMPRAAAQAIIAQSLRSASGLISHGGMTPESLKTAMSTPAGITLNSLVQLDAEARPGMARSLREAIRYANSMND